jgi:hypothetical protein
VHGIQARIHTHIASAAPLIVTLGGLFAIVSGDTTLDSSFGGSVRTLVDDVTGQFVYIVLPKRFLVDRRQATNVGALQAMPCNRRIASLTIAADPRSDHVRCAVRASKLVVELAQQTVDAVFKFVDLQPVLLVEASLVHVLVVESDTVDGQDSLEDPFGRCSARKREENFEFNEFCIKIVSGAT